MIELPRFTPASAPTTVKIVGLGGAGCNMLDRMVLDGPAGAGLIAMNTDIQALAGAVAAKKVRLGESATRGLGAGGDPEVGYRAAEEAFDQISAALQGASLVIVVAGLGGGTGSGAAPLVVHAARQHAAMVVVFATLPFEFEGKRRWAQAAESLRTLRQTADLVICFENDRMSEGVAPKAGIQEAFAAADDTIAQSIRLLVQLAERRGPLHAGLDEVAAVLSGPQNRALFGCGEAQGQNRVHEALAAALKNPLLDRGRRFREVENAIVHVAGGPDVTLDEVQILMTEVHRHIPESARLFFGLAIEPGLAGRLVVTLFSAVEEESCSAAERASFQPLVAASASPEETDRNVLPAEEAEEEVLLFGGVAGAAPVADGIALGAKFSAHKSEPRKEDVRKAPAGTRTPVPPSRRRPEEPSSAAPLAPREQKAEQMQFEPVNRGRFEKSEPTIVDGQDLDVPTFLRRARLK